MKWCTFITFGAVFTSLALGVAIPSPGGIPIRLSAQDKRDLLRFSGRRRQNRNDATIGRIGSGPSKSEEKLIAFGDIPEEIPSIPDWTTPTENQTTTEKQTTTTETQTTTTVDISTTEAPMTTTEQRTTVAETTTRETTTDRLTTTIPQSTTTQEQTTTQQQTTTEDKTTTTHVPVTTKNPTTTTQQQTTVVTEKETTATENPTTTTTDTPTTTGKKTTTTEPLQETTTTTTAPTLTTVSTTTTDSVRTTRRPRPNTFPPIWPGGEDSSESDDYDDWWGNWWGYGDDDYDNYDYGFGDDFFNPDGFDDDFEMFAFSDRTAAAPKVKQEPKNKAVKLARMIEEKLDNMHKNAKEWLQMFSDSKLQNDTKLVKRLVQLNKLIDSAYEKVVKKFLQSNKALK